MQVLYNTSMNRFNYHSGISFQMKKSEFKGIDRKVVEDTRVDVEPFKDMGDFYKYCNGLTDDIKNKDYGGRSPEAKEQRKAMLQEWFDYVPKGNEAYTPAISYMILYGITKGLKPNEDSLPPVLNKGILAQTVEDAQNQVNKENNLKFNFGKMYKLNLQNSYLSTDKNKTLDENLNGWIIIPSKEQDPENFDENVEKLKMLSHDNWCTKSLNAEPYLKKGEFHVYMEKGNPRLGVRFVGDKIDEIQGPRNNSKIPLKYSDIAMEHIKDYELTYNAQKEVNDLNKIKEEIEKFHKKFPNGIENATTQEILEKFGIKCKKDNNRLLNKLLGILGLKNEKDDDGLLIISHYGQPDEDFTYEDLGIKENKLFKDIKEIEGDADFGNSQVTSLGNLQKIGGDADFRNSQVTDLGKLQTIGGFADFRNSQVTDLGKLQTIGGYARFENSKITSLGELKSIGWSANFENSKITDLGNLKSIGGYAYFKNSQVADLGNLQLIGKNANFEDSQIINLGNLQTIGGDAVFRNSKVESLGQLKKIGGFADFRNSQVTDLGNLQLIGGNSLIRYSKLKPSDFDNIEIVGELVA